MEFLEQIFVAIALAMDAFAISICIGLSSRDKIKDATSAGIWFGGAQGLMALIGYFLGYAFKDYIEAVDHWIAFALLLFIGITMIKESIESKKAGEACERRRQSMPLLAIASSIDALAVGVSISLVTSQIASPVIIIGIASLVISFIGVYAGHIVGARRKFIAELAGGVILIGIGVKILLESYLV